MSELILTDENAKIIRVLHSKNKIVARVKLTFVDEEEKIVILNFIRKFSDMYELIMINQCKNVLNLIDIKMLSLAENNEWYDLVEYVENDKRKKLKLKSIEYSDVLKNDNERERELEFVVKQFLLKLNVNRFMFDKKSELMESSDHKNIEITMKDIIIDGVHLSFSDSSITYSFKEKIVKEIKNMC